MILTGRPDPDMALGVANHALPCGEIYGPESSGKTTVALHVVAGSAEDGRSVAASIDGWKVSTPLMRVSSAVDVDQLASPADTGEWWLWNQ